MVHPYFSVIIPAHNEEDYISQTIESILNQTEQDFEIIVVLDNCTDGTPEIVQNWAMRDKRIDYITTTKGSAAGARNAGAWQALGKVLLFQDADCIAQRDLLVNCWMRFEDMNIDGIATRTTNTKPKTWVQRAVATQRAMRWENKEFHMKLINEFSGINVAVMKRDVFNKLNGFNESIFYFEDNDLTQRFFKSGYKAIFDPDIIQYHIDPLSMTESTNQCKSIAKGMKIRLNNGGHLTMGEYVTLGAGALSIFTFDPEIIMFLYTYYKSRDFWGSIYFSTLWTWRAFAKLYYLIREFV